MMRQSRLATLAVGLLLLNGCSGGGGAASAVALQSILSQLDSALQNHESTLNVAAGDKLNQLTDDVDKEMKKAASYGKDFDNATTAQREAFVAAATNLIRRASRLTIDVGDEITENVNKTLIAEAVAIQAVPFTNRIGPFILGTEPLTVTDINHPIQVRAYAFIPSGIQPQDVVIQINGEELQAKLFSDNRIGFTIPPGLLKAKQINTYDVVFTEKHWLKKDEVIRISGDIEADDPLPWECNVIFSVQNPSSQAQITGRPVDIRADSSHSTVDRTLTAEELFSLIGGNTQKYVASSARIAKLSASVPSSSKPCACGRDPSARIISQTEESVRVNLTAPSTPYGRVCGHGLFHRYICGGGGSNITYRLSPILLVDVKGASKTTPGEREQVAVGRNTLKAIAVKLTEWRQASATCTYQNGPITFNDHVALDQGQAKANSDLNFLELTHDSAGTNLVTRF